LLPGGFFSRRFFFRAVTTRGFPRSLEDAHLFQLLARLDDRLHRVRLIELDLQVDPSRRDHPLRGAFDDPAVDDQPVDPAVQRADGFVVADVAVELFDARRSGCTAGWRRSVERQRVGHARDRLEEVTLLDRHPPAQAEALDVLRATADRRLR
jgi:hypothetical protein